MYLTNRDRARRWVRAVFVCAVVPLALGGLFTWDGSDGDDWSADASWAGLSPGYPDDSGDDAVFSEVDGTWDVNQKEDLTIDDFTISFEDGGTFRLAKGFTLTVDSLTVYGPTSGTGNTFVEFKTQARLKTTGN